MSLSAASAPGCADVGSAARTLACRWNQQRCSRVAGNTSRTALPEPERAVTDSQHRRGHPAAATIPQQIGPRLSGLPIPVGQSDELLAAIGTHPDHHQQAQLF